VAPLREAPDVISEGPNSLLSAALQIPVVAKMHIRALEVFSEDLSEVIPAINDVSWQTIQLGLGKIC
jgi:hypothetical protein